MRTAKIKKKKCDLPNAFKGMEKLDHSYLAYGNIRWRVSREGNELVSYKTKYRILIL